MDNHEIRDTSAISLIQDMQNELDQCREDSRAAMNHIFQVFVVAVAILTIIFSFQEKAGELAPKHQLITRLITMTMMCAAFSYVLTIGILTMVRHHYSKDLENKLDKIHIPNEKDPFSTMSPPFLHWVHVVAPLITLNRKRTRSLYTRIYSFYFLLSFAFVLMLGILFVWAQIDIGSVFTLPPFLKDGVTDESLNHITKISLIIFITYMILYAFMIWFTTQKSMDFYNFTMQEACRQAELNNLNSAESARRSTAGQGKKMKAAISKIKAISYYIYPRPNDLQKSLFLILGILLGTYGYAQSFSSPASSFREIFLLTIKVLVILDFCAYQARYQWNDLRGLGEDKNHPLSDKRSRLPSNTSKPLVPIRRSSITLYLRLAVGITLTFIFREMRLPLLLGIASIFVLAAFYEWARSSNRTKLIFLFVCLGYPLRIAFGIWAAWPSVISDFTYLYVNNTGIYAIFSLILLGAGLFGVAFVTLTWAHEANYMMRHGKANDKPHLDFLGKKIPDELKKSKNPLQERGHFFVIWNWSYVLSMISLTVAILVATDFSRCIMVCSFSSAIVALICCLIGKRRIILFVPTIILSAAEILLCILTPITPFPSIAVLIAIIQAIFIFVYVFFRQTNYEALNKGFTKSFQEFMEHFERLVLGKPTWDYLSQLRKKKAVRKVKPN